MQTARLDPDIQPIVNRSSPIRGMLLALPASLAIWAIIAAILL